MENQFANQQWRSTAPVHSAFDQVDLDASS